MVTLDEHRQRAYKAGLNRRAYRPRGLSDEDRAELLQSWKEGIADSDFDHDEGAPKRKAHKAEGSGESESADESENSDSDEIEPFKVSNPFGGLSAVRGQGISFLGGVFGFAVLMAYLDYGTPGVKSWFSAKFLNQPAPIVPGAPGSLGAAVGPGLKILQQVGPIEPITGPLPTAPPSTGGLKSVP